LPEVKTVPGVRQRDVKMIRTQLRAIVKCQEPGCPWPPENLEVKGNPTDDPTYAKLVRYAVREHALLWPNHVVRVDVTDRTEYVYEHERIAGADVPDA
jgi:hypothetical protein